MRLPKYLSYLTEDRERWVIEVKIPRITFSTDRYHDWNMWHFTGWLLTSLLGLCGVALIASIVAFWGHALYRNATTQPKPLNAKSEFIKACRGASYHNVPNTGFADPSKWTCEASDEK